MSELRKYIVNKYENLKLYQPFCRVNKNVLELDLKNNIEESIFEDSKALERVYIRALHIFKNLFNDNDNILFVINKYDEYQWEIIQNEDGEYDRKDLYCESTYTQSNLRINPYILNKIVLKNLNCIVTDLGESNEVGIQKVHNFYTSCKVKDIRYKKLIRELIEEEVVNSLKGMADYYIVHKEKGYVYHLCNDEWVDLSFKNDDDFEFFKEKYSKYMFKLEN
ncbi:DUF3885 domain-containing protein [Paraclostridium bifermentans]|uniref:DUF3885 domain-containing protein n=1 Tax=Paraclostridium bifermentans TaxID=1490 RepID=UPI000A172D55|nr:hypothetical protein [Paraclostridium bifermentans]OSB09164.1 hypothetical protein B2H97_12665 [Paraclostridium bifermentans]